MREERLKAELLLVGGIQVIHKTPAVLVLTLGLAPYRADFFHQLAVRLQRRLAVVILQRSPEVARYGWQGSAPSGELSIITVSDEKTLQQRQHPQTTLRKGFFQTPPTLRQWLEILRRRPAIIYSSEASLFCWPALLYSLLTKAPLVLETDMGPMIRWRLSSLKRWNQWLFRKQAALIVGRRQDCLRDGPKVVFAPHAVDAAHFRPGSPKRKGKEVGGAPVFLFVGVPSPTKGLDLFAQAAGHAARKAVFQIQIIGANKSQVRSLREIFRATGFKGPLSIHGFLSGADLLREYQRADVFVFPSRFDTYGVVVHEAACCGLPLLVSRFAGASQNLVSAGRNGYVIDPADTRAFAARLVELARHPQRRRQMGRESRKLGLRYSVEKQAAVVARRILVLAGKSAKQALGPSP